MKKALIAVICVLLIFTSMVSANNNVSLEDATIEELQKALSYGLISCEEITKYCVDRNNDMDFPP